MLTFSVASVWQSLQSVPGRSSRRMVNSLTIGIFGFSFWYTSGMSWGDPARSKDSRILRRRESDCKAHSPQAHRPHRVDTNPKRQREQPHDYETPRLVCQVHFPISPLSRKVGHLPREPRGDRQVYTARARREYVATNESNKSPGPRVVLSGRFPNG